MRTTTATRRLLASYAAASPEALHLGRTWYRQARAHVRRIATLSGRTRGVVAGVMAALSPRAHWVTNLRWCEESCVSGVATGNTLSNRGLAREILGGAKPLSVLSGPKVRAFYRACYGDDCATVVDVWMQRAVGLDSLAPADYCNISRGLMVAAFIVDEHPVEFQAIVWCHQRGRAN